MIKSLGVQQQIIAGFIFIILLLGSVNFFLSSELGQLESAYGQISARTTIVGTVNSYTSDIDQQVGSLRAFAFSGLENDQKRVARFRAKAAKSRKAVETLLKDSGRSTTAKSLNSVAAEFDQVFTNIEGRLGNDADAIQVFVLAASDAGRSSEKLIQFLRAQNQQPMTDLASKIKPLVFSINQLGLAFITSLSESDYSAVIAEGDKLATLLDGAAPLFKSMKRRDRRLVRFFERDIGIMRQTIRSRYASNSALTEALNNLEVAAARISAINATISDQAQKAQSGALDDLSRQIQAAVKSSTTGTLVSSLIAFVLAIWIGRTVSRRLNNIATTMTGLAAGNKDLEIPYQDRQDEIGKLAQAAAIFKEEAFELEQVAQAKVVAEQQAAEAERQTRAREEAAKLREAEREQQAMAKQTEERKAHQMSLAAQLEANISSVVENVAVSADDLSHAATEMKDNADSTKELSRTAASNSEQATSNMDRVSAAMRDMDHAMNRVSDSVLHAQNRTSEAVTYVEQSQTRIKELSASAGAIKNIVKLIQDIAEQTNLLALNATIEAARAGDAGRGFAVVASEVKSLAGQTALATEQIESQVAAMTTQTSLSVESMASLYDTMASVSDLSQAIVDSVQEQSAAQSTIEASISEATAGVLALNQDIQDVRERANSSDQAAENVSGSTVGLKELATNLQQALQLLLSDIKSNV